MGYKSECIREYFLNFYRMNSDVTVALRTNSVEVHSVDHSCDWKVTLAYTGELTMTGGESRGRSSATWVMPSITQSPTAMG